VNFGVYLSISAFSASELSVKLFLLFFQVNIYETFNYRAFHIFGQAKFPDGGSVLGSSQFSVLPQLLPKMMLGLKEVKID
jgi:hypothetical protein